MDKFSSIGQYDIDSNGIATAKTSIKTFSSLDLIFYKTSLFDKKNDWTRSEFENLVTVEEQ